MENGLKNQSKIVTQNDQISNGSLSSSASSCSYTLPKNLNMSRGFSKVQANEEILNETRLKIENNLFKSDNIVTNNNIINELTDYSFMLPNLNKIEDYKFREYLQNDLIETPTEYSLTESGHLNWWTLNDWENVCRSLYPMVTSGDGNCLLHAASLAMWGLHDRHLILRKSLHSTLEQIKPDSALWRRWKWEQMCQNRKYGLIYDEDEWSKEWQSLLKLSSYQPRINNNSMSKSNSTTTANNLTSQIDLPVKNIELFNSEEKSNLDKNISKEFTDPSNQNECNNSVDENVYFESLEEFHVFLLAHILQRPIIIVSDTMLHDLDGEPLAPIPFGGIYLPLECDINSCNRYPLVLAYDSAHFSALVLMDDDDYYEDKNKKINDFEVSEVDKINKKLQVKPPYSIIPITYSNNELLPVHFAYDPGEKFDWSKFPNLSNPTQIEEKNSLTNIQQEKSNSATSNTNEQIDLTPDQKMVLIQRYLDILKLQLYDPGPILRLNLNNNKENLAINTSGMCVNATNVRVLESTKIPSSASINSKLTKNAKTTVNNKLQKLINIFKKDNNSEIEKSTENTFKIKENKKISKSIRPISSDFYTLNENVNITSIKSTNSDQIKKQIKLPPISNNKSIVLSNRAVHHKLALLKNWNCLFDSMINHTCLLCVKMNLAKPIKFNRIIQNYLESAKQKYDQFKLSNTAIPSKQHKQVYIENVNQVATM